MLVPASYIPLPRLEALRTRRPCSGEMAQALVVPMMHCMTHRRRPDVVSFCDGEAETWDTTRSTLNATRSADPVRIFFTTSIQQADVRIAVAVLYRAGVRQGGIQPSLTISATNLDETVTHDTLGLTVAPTETLGYLGASVFETAWACTGDSLTSVVSPRPLIVPAGTDISIRVAGRTAVPYTQVMSVSAWELADEEVPA